MTRRRGEKPKAPAVSAPTSITTWRFKPLPVPAAILNLRDVRDVQRARDAWNLANELYQVFNCWAAWFDQWEKTGEADPSLPAYLRDEAEVCAKGLWVLGINSAFFLLDSHKAAEIFDEMLPPVPNPHTSPNWSRDPQFRKLVLARLSSAEMSTLYRELRIIIGTLSKVPMLAFSGDGGDSRPPSGETGEPSGPSDKRIPEQAGGRKTRREKVGRPSGTDHEEDRNIANTWKTGVYKTLKALADALGKKKPDVKRALDRHRHRVGKTRSRNPRQES
jgi:hypothetical protein